MSTSRLLPFQPLTMTPAQLAAVSFLDLRRSRRAAALGAADRLRIGVSVRLSAMDRDGRQELHYRALEGDLAGIKERLAEGDEAGLADRQGMTALHFAAQQSQADAVRLLLASGAPVDPKDCWGNTPLWKAVFDSRGQLPTVQTLLEAGADPDTENDAGDTPETWPRGWAQPT